MRNLPSLPPMRSGVTQENRKKNNNVYVLSAVCDTFLCRKKPSYPMSPSSKMRLISPSTTNKTFSIFPGVSHVLELENHHLASRERRWSLRRTSTFVFISMYNTRSACKITKKLKRKLQL